MADNYYLTSPQGTQVNLGSWLDAEKGIDFGAKDVLKQEYAENSLVEGRRFAYEHAGARRMSFPLLAASGGAGLSLDALHAVLSRSARPGAYIDLKPDGVPTAEMVRFDIVGGQVKLDDYSVHLQRVARRRLTVELETQPYGYWPTAILLASSASVGLPGSLKIPGSSMIGDIPGRARIVVSPTIATQYGAPTWMPDFVAWGMGVASFTPWQPAITGKFTTFTNPPGSVTGDQYAPASQAVILAMGTVASLGVFSKVAELAFSTFYDLSYRGRFRVFLLAQVGPSQAQPWRLSVDVNSGYSNAARAMASSAPLATLAPPVASGTPGAFGAQPSPGYTILDCGEVGVFPGPVASTDSVEHRFRVWAAPATTNVGVPSPFLKIAGLFLQPLADDSGVMPRGLVTPTIAAGTQNTQRGRRMIFDNYRLKTAFVGDQIGGAEIDENSDFWHAAGIPFYVGHLPRIVATTTSLALLGGVRKIAASTSDPVAWAGSLYAQVAVHYQPQFRFLKGI